MSKLPQAAANNGDELATILRSTADGLRFKTLTKAILPPTIIIVFFLLVGIGSGIGVYYFFKGREDNNYDRQLVTRSSQQMQNVRQILSTTLLQATYLRALISNYPYDITFKQFLTFLKLSNASMKGVFFLQFTPLVRHRDRSSFEQQAATYHGMPGYYIKDFADSGPVASPVRDVYFPILFTFPYELDQGDVPVFMGFDLSSNPARNESLWKCLGAKGNNSATARIRLVEETENLYSFLLFAPIYSQVAPASLAAASSDDFNGFVGVVLGVFRVKEIIQASLESLGKLVEVKVFDITPGVRREEMYLYSSNPDDFFLSQDEHDAHISKQRFQYSETLEVADRIWVIYFFPTTDFFKAYNDSKKVIALVVAIILGFLIGIISAFVIKRIEFHFKLRRVAKERMQLLNKILPLRVVQRIVKGESFIAESQVNISLLFLDLVGFTQMCGSVTPEDLVQFLNVLFSEMDEYCEKYHLEKIKTIGDCYFVSTLSSTKEQEFKRHARNIGLFALSVVAQISKFSKNAEASRQLNCRCGVHFGQVIAGVIGKIKPHFDVWGDDVNLASRMESTGVPGRIQVTEAYQTVTKDFFDFEPRHGVEVKGKGTMTTYFLLSEKIAGGSDSSTLTAPQTAEASGSASSTCSTLSNQI